MPDLCQRIADLAHLDDLGERKNNNLRAVNGSRGTDSVPGHLVFNHLQTPKTTVSFHFVPIPGAPEFARGMKLRLNEFTPGSRSAARPFPLDVIVDRSKLPGPLEVNPLRPHVPSGDTVYA